MGRPSRRALLAVVGGAAVGGFTAAAGCLGRGEGAPAVSAFAARGLQRAFTTEFDASNGTHVEIEVRGSAYVIRMINGDQRDPDIVTLVDPALFDAPLLAPWYAALVSNALVVACNSQTKSGTRVTEVASWPGALLDDAVSLGRTDLDLDPLGCRIWFALTLATDHYGRLTLTVGLLRHDQIYPETQLLAQLDTDGVDATFVHRNTAVERDYPYLELSAVTNLSGPDHASTYATVSYTFPDGTIVRGDPARYVVTCRIGTTAAKSVFETFIGTAGNFLEPSGLTVRASHLHYFGDVPPTT